MNRLQKNMTRLLDLLPAGEFLTLADVGSMGGLEGEWRALEAHPQFRCVGFEPDDREFRKLEPDPRHRYFPYALNSRAHQALDFFVSRESGKSSVLAPNMELLERFPFPERFRTREVIHLAPDRVSTLDEALNDRSLAPDFLKLDTQGSEKSILEGGRRLLAESILGLKVEIEFIEIYRGQSLFADVDGLLRAHGFELMDLRRVYWKTSANRACRGRGQLVFGDALYLKSPSGVIAKDPNFIRCLKFLIICLVYGSLDPALELLNLLLKCPEPRLKGLNAVHQVFQEATRSMSGIRIPGSRSLARCLLRALWFLTRSGRGFADSDAMLGNRWLY